MDIEQVFTFYGKIAALKGISLKVYEGEIVTLIGANGAGKTTTLMAISGINHIASGSIYYSGKLINNISSSEIAQLGICQVPEGRQIFSRLTVEENLKIGAYLNPSPMIVRSRLKNVFNLFPILKDRRSQLGGTLSGGEQQMLAMGRALMLEPKVLLMDEPSLGLAPLLVDRIFNIIRNVNENGTAILLVEQNAVMALSVANRGYVIESGKIVLEDKSMNLMKSSLIKKSYLGS